jgi:ATP-dependent Clp protease ATP-binding subunit ClpB
MAKLILLDTNRPGRQSQDLEKKLRSLVVGQDEAIREVLNAYQNHVTGLSAPGRPVANLLFLGPTGSGKTRIVEAIAESLFNDSQAVVKIDCAEYQHSHEVAKLIGSPPGYLGHRETHALLSQEVLNCHHTDKIKLSLVLFDEIEKASDALWNLLLGILDKGVLTLGDNRKVDFSRSMIFLTSNLGAAEMSALSEARMGFQSPVSQDAGRPNKLERIGTAAARRKFTPEFINRLDRIVVFKPLGNAELNKILDIELEAVRRRFLSACSDGPFDLDVTEDARQLLLKEGADARYGARHLKRAVERLLVAPMSNLLASGQIQAGDSIRVSHRADWSSLMFFREAAARDYRRSAGSMAA